MCPRTAWCSSSSRRSLAGHSAIIASLTFTYALETFHPSWEHCVYTIWQCKHSLKGSPQQAREVEQTGIRKVHKVTLSLIFWIFFYTLFHHVTVFHGRCTYGLLHNHFGQILIEYSEGAEFKAFSTFNKIPFVHN